jgi:predicted glutamine amidotransferase
MCVIVHKPANVKIEYPDLRDMWMSNPDGAGLGYYNPAGRLIVLKGFMTLSHYWSTVRELQDVDLVLHLRWSTHGLTNAAQTHPFVISDKIHVAKGRRLETKSPKAVLFHNGVLSSYGCQKVSDTLDFTMRVLARSDSVQDWQDILESVGCKFALMTGGETFLIGGFQKYKDMEVSNKNFRFTYGHYELKTEEVNGTAITRRHWVTSSKRKSKKQRRAERKRKRIQDIKQDCHHVAPLPAKTVEELATDPTITAFDITDDGCLLWPEDVNSQDLDDFGWQDELSPEARRLLNAPVSEEE